MKNSGFVATIVLCIFLAVATSTRAQEQAVAPPVQKDMAQPPNPAGGPKQPVQAAERREIHGMKGYVQDIDYLTRTNNDFRHVLYTAKDIQLVLMALKPKEEIGTEVHKKVDQFFRVEAGTGEAVLNGVRIPVHEGSVVIAPAGESHNIVNTGNVPLKLYTLYAPPNHRDGVVQHTRAEAEDDDEHFDGKTTE